MFVKEDLVPMKGKRSKRARADSPPLAASSTADDVVSSCNVSAEFRDEEDEDMANCLILLARGEKSSPPRGGGFYQCKTCSKSFPSFQALGGHRASHTKPVKEEKRAGWTERRELLLPICGESTILSLQIPTGNLPGSKSRVHECSICGAEFASGQALGGHMRRHRPIPTCGGERGSSPEGKRARSSNVMSLDLNLPAPEDEDQMESKFPFAAKQVIVFSASSMVDCHY